MTYVDETITDGGTAYRLAAQRWGPDTATLRGFVSLERFRLEGILPTRTYALDDALLEKRGGWNRAKTRPACGLDHREDHLHAATFDAASDTDLLRDLFPVLEEIVQWHVDGTRCGIQVDSSGGLLRAASPVCSSRGWTRRWATGSSRPASESP